MRAEDAGSESSETGFGAFLLVYVSRRATAAGLCVAKSVPVSAGGREAVVVMGGRLDEDRVLKMLVKLLVVVVGFWRWFPGGSAGDMAPVASWTRDVSGTCHSNVLSHKPSFSSHAQSYRSLSIQHRFIWSTCSCYYV